MSSPENNQQPRAAENPDKLQPRDVAVSLGVVLIDGVLKPAEPVWALCSDIHPNDWWT